MFLHSGLALSCQPKRLDASLGKVSRDRRDQESPKSGSSLEAVRSLTFSQCRMLQSCRHTTTSSFMPARRNSLRTFMNLFIRIIHGSIKGPITIPQSTLGDLTVLSMPQVSFEFLKIASLSRRRHGFDSRTGRQIPSAFLIFSNVEIVKRFLNGRSCWTQLRSC